MAGSPSALVFTSLSVGLMILAAGCVFDSAGLPPSSRPSKDGGAGARDRGAVTGDGPLARPDKKVQPPPDTAAAGCPKGKIRCGKLCVSPSSDKNNCGACGKTCKANQRCISGLCCNKGWANCSKLCANVKADKNNCGKCAHKCKPTEVCKAGKCGTTGPCVSGITPQPFGGGMVGCAGQVSFPKRATLCNPQYVVCAATQWVAGHGAKAPKYNYWTNDVLHYVGPKNACFVSPSYGNKCWPGMPMRVCAGDPDPLGNKCNWQACGYKTPAPKHFFGGCNDNPTAGTLCCPK